MYNRIKKTMEKLTHAVPTRFTCIIAERFEDYSKVALCTITMYDIISITNYNYK